MSFIYQINSSEGFSNIIKDFYLNKFLEILELKNLNIEKCFFEPPIDIQEQQIKDTYNVKLNLKELVDSDNTGHEELDMYYYNLTFCVNSLSPDENEREAIIEEIYSRMSKQYLI